jgi:hypothetical protein
MKKRRNFRATSMKKVIFLEKTKIFPRERPTAVGLLGRFTRAVLA